MEIKFLVDCKYSQDGFTKESGKKDEIKDIRDDLALSLIKCEFATDKIEVETKPIEIEIKPLEIEEKEKPKKGKKKSE